METMGYVPDDRQLWCLDDQTDGSFLIVSKLAKQALACINNTGVVHIVMQDLFGSPDQLWLIEDNKIVSYGCQVALCIRNGCSDVQCAQKNSTQELEYCSLQASVSLHRCSAK